MYNILQHAHSGFRWLVLTAIVAAIITAITQWNKHVQDGTQLRYATSAMIVTHIQFLLGLIIYFVSPKVQFAGEVMKDDILRFYTVEHFAMMFIAVILITVGHGKAKRRVKTMNKAKTIFWYYLIALIIILAAIPWPFREGLGGGWF